MVKKKSEARGSGKGKKDWKKRILAPLMLVVMVAVPSLILTSNSHPIVKSADAIVAHAAKQGQAEYLTRSPYRRGTFEVLLKLDGKPVHCNVFVHKGLSYAACGEPLGVLVIDKDGKVTPS